MLNSFLHYRIIEKLGQGGMGIVYYARDTKLERNVAIKFLPGHISKDSTERKRFLHEAQSSAALNHPHIAQVYAIEEVDDELFIVMEYIEGQELKEAIEEDRLSSEQKYIISKQIAQGIKAAHDKGIIHRDIKTRNIMLDGEDQAKIMDFGLARIQGSDHITRTGTTLGTMAYMAPEQIAGEQMDEQSDIWAFGVVLYELFTEELPFKGIYDPAVMYAIAEEEPIPPTELKPDIPFGIESIILNCLVKDRGARYQTMDEVLKDLMEDEIPKQRVVKKSNTRRTIPYLLGAGIPAILVILLFFFSPIGLPWQSKNILPKKYLAVLPIENIDRDPSMQAICDGLAETFSYKLSELEKYEDSYWVAPASEMRQQNVKSASQANKMFGVNLAILSSIQSTRDSTRLILELVDADKVRRLETKKVSVESQNMALLEQKGIQAMMQMLDIENDPKIEKNLHQGGPTNPDAYGYYLKGRASLQDYVTLDSLDKSIGLFKQAINIDQDFPLAHAGLGESYWRKYEITGDVEMVREAKSALDKAEQLNKELAPVQLLLGMVSGGTGEYNTAIEHFNKALDLDRNYTVAYRELANIYEEKGDIDKAVATYRYAISLKPGVGEGYNNLGRLFLRIGDYDAAVEQFKNVIAITPSNSAAYSYLGASYYYQGKYDQAVEAYQMSLALGYNRSAASNLATIYYVEEQYEKAAQMYELVLKRTPNSYELLANLAAAYDEIEGKEEKAHEMYLKAIEKGQDQLEINPNDAELIADLGAYYLDVEDSTQALEYNQKALGLHEDLIAVRLRAVQVFEKLGMREEALRWISPAIMTDLESQMEMEELVKDPKYMRMREELVKESQE